LHLMPILLLTIACSLGVFCCHMEQHFI
jgi:hypothetical protein